MARNLLSEREEEVRVLTNRVSILSDEIASGAPSERRIFELAQTQAKREATHQMHTDSRSVAFVQLQQTLASKDLDLARAQQSLSELTAEVTDLRRTHLREGINMDYLKNIVVQYMSFPVQSSEKLSLVPVIAMLLQFSGKEMAEVQKAIREESLATSLSLFGTKGVSPSHSQPAKEIKRGGTTKSASASTVIARNIKSSSPKKLSQSQLQLQVGSDPVRKPLDKNSEASNSDRDLREKLKSIKTDILSFPSDDLNNLQHIQHIESPPPSPISTNNETSVSQSI